MKKLKIITILTTLTFIIGCQPQQSEHLATSNEDSASSAGIETQISTKEVGSSILPYAQEEVAVAIEVVSDSSGAGLEDFRLFLRESILDGELAGMKELYFAADRYAYCVLISGNISTEEQADIVDQIRSVAEVEYQLSFSQIESSSCVTL